MKWIKRHIFLIGIGVLVLLVIGYFMYEQAALNSKTAVLTNPNPEAAVSAMSGTDEVKGDSAQNETKRNPLDTYRVAADQPRALYIPSINVASRIKPMGLTAEKSIQAPTNIYDAGWYTGSSKPGDAGATFIDGHASGSTRMGLFAYVDTLKTGDELSIEMGDGTRFNYEVMSVEVVHKDAVDMNKVLSTYDGAEKGVNLMGCTGKWIEAEKTYDHRVVVYAVQV